MNELPQCPHKYYFAYGSNCNIESMISRCQHAQVVGKAVLDDYRLRISSHCDIVEYPGFSVEGVVWKISERDEKMLDVYEGYPSYYEKTMVTVTLGDGTAVECMTYYISPLHQNKHVETPPSRDYTAVVITGYKDHDINESQYIEALFECHD